MHIIERAAETNFAQKVFITLLLFQWFEKVSLVLRIQIENTAQNNQKKNDIVKGFVSPTKTFISISICPIVFFFRIFINYKKNPARIYSFSVEQHQWKAKDTERKSEKGRAREKTENEIKSSFCWGSHSWNRYGLTVPQWTLFLPSLLFFFVCLRVCVCLCVYAVIQQQHRNIRALCKHHHQIQSDDLQSRHLFSTPLSSSIRIIKQQQQHSHTAYSNTLLHAGSLSLYTSTRAIVEAAVACSFATAHTMDQALCWSWCPQRKQNVARKLRKKKQTVVLRGPCWNWHRSRPSPQRYTHIRW